MNSMQSSPSQSSLSRKIKIRCGERSMNVFVTNNALKKTVLKDYFPEGGTLTYQIDGESYLLDTDAQFIYLNTNVEVYDFNVPKSVSQLSGKRRKRFHDILETLYAGKKSDEKCVKKKLSEQKITNKKQGNLSLEVENSSLEVNVIEEEKPFIKRVVYLGWKHRKNLNSRFECMGITVGPKVKIILNGNQDYPLEKLKSVFLKEYITENNKCYFDNSTVEIGTFNETVIEAYIHEGKEYDFWNFCKYRLRKKSHMLNLYLLTTKKNTCISNNSNKEPFDITNTPCSLSIDKCSKVVSNLLNSLESIHGINESDIQKKSSSGISLNTSGYTSGLNQISTNKKKSENINISEKSFLLEKTTDYTIETKRKQEKSILQDVTNKVKISSQFRIPVPQKCKMLNVDDNNIKDSVFSSQHSKLIDINTKSKINKNHRGNGDTFTFSEAYNKTLDTEKIYSFKLSIQLIKEKDIQFSNIILGKGAQGVVTKGKYLGSHVAIKSILKTKDDKLILREIMLLDKIRHPNIISIMAACSSITQFHIVMEYFKSDSLFDIIFNPEVKKRYFVSLENKNKIAYQVSCALTFLHLQPVPILHRDLKPGNILVNENFETKLCDLGLSKCKSVNESLQSTQADTIRGTYLFMAPEILLHRQEASKSSDVWAFACTLVELFNEETVWDVRNFFNSWCCAKENLEDKNVPNMNKIPFYLTEMLTKCFNYDAAQRPDVIEFLNLFEEIQ